MRLTGKVALVTGAGRGIGKVVAQHLGAEGASVVVNYTESEQGARDATQAITNAGGKAISERADVSDVAQVRNLVDQTIAAFGRLDILVNNSGVDPNAPFFDIDEAFFQKVIETKLKGTFFCSHYAAREMRKLGLGRIINRRSVHGQATMPGFSVYSASKGAIDALTRQVALDLAAY